MKTLVVFQLLYQTIMLLSPDIIRTNPNKGSSNSLPIQRARAPINSKTPLFQAKSKIIDSITMIALMPTGLLVGGGWVVVIYYNPLLLISPKRMNGAIK